MSEIDPATFEVVKNALYCAAEEMKVVLAKTAYSPLLKVAGDYSCGLFDVEGEMVAQGPDLPDHVAAAGGRAPRVHGPHEAAERQLRSDGDQDQRTAPKYWGAGTLPVVPARCGHCVSQRSAYGRTRWPARESSSALAMLSTQMVRLPRYLARRSAK